MLCTRYGCDHVGDHITALGGRCATHSKDPLMTLVQVSRPNQRVTWREVPFSLIAPHARQAQENHGQTLQRLEERGGLCESELLAVLEDRPWRSMDEREAGERVSEMVAAMAPPDGARGSGT